MADSSVASERSLGTDAPRSLTAAERKWIRRRRRWTKRFAMGTLLAGIAAGAWGLEGSGPSLGLKDIFPEEVPAALAADAFESLGPTWSKWSEETAAAIASFYKLEGDATSQREQLAGLKKRLAVLDTATRDSKYARIHNGLLSVRGPLARRIGLAEGILDTLEADPQSARTKHIAGAAAHVSAALTELETDVKSVPGGAAWLPFVKAQELADALKSSPDSEAATTALNSTKSKLARRETMTDVAQKAFLSRPAFLALESAINDHLASMAAPLPADNTPALRDALKKLVASVEDYEANDTNDSAAAVRANWKAVKGLAPFRGDRLEAVMAAQYFNYNLRIVASESFLSKLLADSRTESGQVSDFILGANVGGQQTTSTTVGVDLKPAADRARFDLVLNGTVQSNTAGATSQATIYTSGYHTFVARKEVVFDGQTFRTSPGTIAVNANNTTTGAATSYSGGLFGRYAERVAMQEAANRRGASEAIARERVSSRVLPKFDSEVNRSFSDASHRLENELYAGLRATELYPDAQHYQSTDNAVRLSTRLMRDDELAGSAAEPVLLPESSGARLVLHESVINNAIDRIGLAGQTMTEEELRHHVEGFLSKALAREFKFSAPQAAPAKAADDEETDQTPSKLAFGKQDPIRVQLQNGVLLLKIRAGLKREGKDPIPEQQITAPIRFTVEGDQIRAAREGLDITGVEENLGAVQRKVMNTKIGNALPERLVSAKVELTGPNKRTVQSRVNRIEIVDGWIAVGLQ